jgi:hypothetical protein
MFGLIFMAYRQWQGLWDLWHAAGDPMDAPVCRRCSPGEFSSLAEGCDGSRDIEFKVQGSEEIEGEPYGWSSRGFKARAAVRHFSKSVDGDY